MRLQQRQSQQGHWQGQVQASPIPPPKDLPRPAPLGWLELLEALVRSLRALHRCAGRGVVMMMRVVMMRV